MKIDWYAIPAILLAALAGFVLPFSIAHPSVDACVVSGSVLIILALYVRWWAYN